MDILRTLNRGRLTVLVTSCVGTPFGNELLKDGKIEVTGN